MKYSLDELRKKFGEGSAIACLTNQDTQNLSIQQKRNDLMSFKNRLENQKTLPKTIEVTSSREMERCIGQASAKLIEKVNQKLQSTELELVIVIDKSSSCSGTEINTMNGVYNLINNLNGKYSNIKFTLVLFDESEEVVFDRESLKRVKSFSYCAIGKRTALYQCLNHQINRIHNLQTREGNAPKTMFAIMTDGRDNCPGDLDENKIKKLVHERQQAGWKFIYLGALKSEEKVIEMATKIGIDNKYSQLYLRENVETNFAAIENALDDVILYGDISPEWSREIKKTLNRSTHYITENQQLLERKKY